MRFSLLRAAIVALALIGKSAFADEPPSIDKLIEQLGSPSFPTRERASKQLKDRGPVALPALRKAMESKDEEVRRRAETLIPQMEIDEALLPKRVTIDKDANSASAIIQDLTKQTGFQLVISGKPMNVPVKGPLAIANIPFWDALEQIAKGTETHPTFEANQNDKKIRLSPTAGRSPFVNIRGPFRLEANWFHEDRDIDFTKTDKDKDGERGHRLTLSVGVLAEPRITFLHIAPAKVIEAIDSEGKSLLEPTIPPKSPTTNPPNRSTFRGESLIATDIRLRRASETAKTAKVIKGTIPVKIILIRKPVVVSSKVTEAGGKTIKAGNESLLITQVMNQGGNNINVTIQVPYDRNGNQREWHERFHVEDDNGNKYQMNGRGTSSNGREYTINMYFTPPFNKKNFGPPTKLVFEDWIVYDYAIPFEFHDVQLP